MRRAGLPDVAESSPVSKPAVLRYDAPKEKAGRRNTILPVALLALGLGIVAASTAFAGWMEHGTAIFLSLAESGMAWCF